MDNENPLNYNEQVTDSSKQRGRKINLRLDAYNQQRLQELKAYFEENEELARLVRTENKMYNFIISEFIQLFLYTNLANKSFYGREAELLKLASTSPEQNRIDKQLRLSRQNEAEIKYLLLSIYNRTAGAVNEGGSIYTPGSDNNIAIQQVRQMIEADIQANQLRQH
ncbi:hypothetical protein I4I21_08335 [Lactiplantibacillus plantarum]|uniref:Uncharacterized protein n=1 Tax=Lactiplantibacillus plantarum TaxID=1590 RepID=A0AAW3RE32_LACPN|nr:hypothetical protein [Lactiplantibacillus plantarum]AOB21294.1 hypothetical protein AVR82_16840 [Lactiplantibacillus plantarum]AOB21344.1 hypothetical protein AVR82_17125 [Lactiplantibacillus plantarum]AOB24674.1 hypothetical protein AVR83_17130 [Lactiplantibacillus plantarum]KZV00465.1 hypothetical protein NAB2_3209 [Lactiplantibacillus plantarum]KZV02940.1 hypothetical protein NAB1_1363 [Lactiplantibacillus plantarum]